ncbi:CCA tRNA nucleotidyltransferase [Thalassospiraceae bacterium LMO-JJ14]|nr:CCA tRNA nucleotidyltransferase [Thalassospiraceae bacterium LMO-JJ14]
MISLNATRDPTGKLNPEPWLTDPNTLSVMNALSAGGADVRYVGGCVRDAIARRPVADIDIGTPEPPEQVIARLKAADIKSIPTGIEHGTVTAIKGGQPFEITTLRCDVETDGRRAVIAYTEDWIIDSSRRDFTINALSANRDGDVYDYHDGIADLAHGRIRFVGIAEERVQEDYLRILRYFRFYAHFGRPPYDDAAFNACRKHAEKLSGISAERIRHELVRTLRAVEPADAFIMMRNAHVLDVVLPEATEIGSLRAAAWLASRGVIIDGLKPDALRRLGALLSPDCDAKGIAQRLRLSNKETERLVSMKKFAPLFAVADTLQNIETRIHKLGNETVGDALILAWAARLASEAKLPAEETALRRKALETAFSWQAPILPIGGEDVKIMGVPRGPEIGTALRAVEDWWADGGFTADREACLEKLKDIFAEQGITDK